MEHHSAVELFGQAFDKKAGLTLQHSEFSERLVSHVIKTASDCKSEKTKTCF